MSARREKRRKECGVGMAAAWALNHGKGIETKEWKKMERA